MQLDTGLTLMQTDTEQTLNEDIGLIFNEESEITLKQSVTRLTFNEDTELTLMQSVSGLTLMQTLD